MNICFVKTKQNALDSRIAQKQKAKELKTMKESCYYCYYHTRCEKLPLYDECGWCSDWKPFVVPRRYLDKLAEEFYTSACVSAAHIYDDASRAYVQRIAFQYTAALHAQLEAVYDERVFLSLGDPERRKAAALAYRKRQGKPY